MITRQTASWRGFTALAAAIAAATVTACPASYNNAIRQCVSVLTDIRRATTSAPVSNPTRSTVPTSIKTADSALRGSPNENCQRFSRSYGDSGAHQAAAGSLGSRALRGDRDARDARRHLKILLRTGIFERSRAMQCPRHEYRGSGWHCRGRMRSAAARYQKTRQQAG